MNPSPLPWWLADSADLLAYLSPEQQDRISTVIYSNYLAGAEPPYRQYIAPLPIKLPALRPAQVRRVKDRERPDRCVSTLDRPPRQAINQSHYPTSLVA
jgi:hypothetical protein